MATEWKEVKIGELGEVVGGATPSTKNYDFYGGDIAWITPKDLSNYNERYITRGERNITELGKQSCSTRLLPKNSILFSSRAPIGYIAIARNEMCTNQGFKSIIANADTDYLFLFYLLKFNKDKIEAMGSGTTFKEVSTKVMQSIKLKVPCKQTQQKIAKILSSLDEKIELNNKINENLHAQAQAIFKSWFVNFEPFGGTMPSDWEEKSLVQLADFVNGLAMQKFRPKENEKVLPVLKIRELRLGDCDSSSELCSSGIKQEYIVNQGDIIFSWSGSLLVDVWSGKQCGLNQHLFNVKPKEFYGKWFVFMWVQYHLDNFIAIANDKATTMGHIKREHLEKAKVFVPAQKAYQQLGKLLNPIFEYSLNLRIKNKKLAQIRDILLPKLMSGELEV